MIISISSHVANGTASFFFMAEKYYTVYMYHIFLIQSSVNGHLGCFYVLAMVNIPGGNIEVQVSFRIMFVCLFFPLDMCLGMRLLDYMLFLI